MSAFKCCVLGSGGVGKTAITVRMLSNHFVEEYDPTIGDCYRKQVVVDDLPCYLEILDTAGQEEFEALRDQWIRDSEAFVLVYAVNDEASLHELDAYKRQLVKVKDSLHLPVAVAGNKCDLEDRRVVSREQGAAKAEEWGCLFFETSAKDSVNVEELFVALIRHTRTCTPDPQPVPPPTK